LFPFISHAPVDIHENSQRGPKMQERKLALKQLAPRSQQQLIALLLCEPFFYLAGEFLMHCSNMHTA